MKYKKGIMVTLVFFAVAGLGRKNTLAKSVGTAFIKPSGYLILNSKFSVEDDIARPKMTLNMEQILKDTSDFNQVIDFDKSLNVPGKGIQFYITKEGDTFRDTDLCTLIWDTGEGIKETILKVDIPERYLIKKQEDNDMEAITYLQEGGYKVKLIIPTNLGSSYTKKTYRDLLTADNKRAIYLKIIKDGTMFEDSPGSPEKVDVSYDVIPYKIPGIN